MALVNAIADLNSEIAALKANVSLLEGKAP